MIMICIAIFMMSPSTLLKPFHDLQSCHRKGKSEDRAREVSVTLAWGRGTSLPLGFHWLKSITCPLLTARETGKYSLAECGGKDMDISAR